jgi:hypothetical protein
VTRPRIALGIARFWASATVEEIVDTLLPDLKPYYDFTGGGPPQIVLYGPYGGGLPPGRYVKVFVGCENLRPLLNECDWAFGVEHEDRVGHPRYMRFARWGDDTHLVQPAGRDWAEVLRRKTRFCAFVFANPVFYREEFCRALARYKPVDAPGRSMNNMASIDPVPGQPDWGAKVAFLRNYKFVVAFENSSWPGYNTEKLTHAIEADSLPIYWGDPEIARSYNAARFVNAHDYLPPPRRLLPRLPYAAHSLHATGDPSLAQRVARRANGMFYAAEQRLWARTGFAALIDRIIEIDRDDELYLRHLRQPLLIGNQPPDRTRWIARWHEIFRQAAAPKPD